MSAVAWYFFAALFIGTLASKGTLLHSFAVSFDMFCQSLLFNDAVGVTLSSRAGLAARKGSYFWAKLINASMFSATHCEDAILADIQRAEESLKLLNE